MLLTYAVSDLPNGPALYAMYGDRRSVAYVGAGGGLRRCVEGHLLRRDSPQATGASAVGINADHVHQVWWWEHSRFVDADALQAAVIVADDVLEPALRNRDPVRLRAREISGDTAFRAEMRELLRSQPQGRLLTPGRVAQWQVLQQLSQQVASLQEKVNQLEDERRD